MNDRDGPRRRTCDGQPVDGDGSDLATKSTSSGRDRVLSEMGRTGMHRGDSGRPAALYRFRREVLRERPSPGLRLGAR